MVIAYPRVTGSIPEDLPSRLVYQKIDYNWKDYGNLGYKNGKQILVDTLSSVSS
jgi:hypothetical protein